MEKNEMIIYEQRCSETLLSMGEISRLVGIHTDMIHRFFQHGLIDPLVEEPEPLFDDTVVGRIEKIIRLRQDLGVNLNGCGLALDLLEKISQLEQQLLQRNGKKHVISHQEHP